MYGILGSPSVPDFPFASRQMEQDKKQTIAGLSVSELLERLKARLKRQPDNIQGWLLLARTSMRLEQYDQAVAAYRKAIALGNNNPDIAVNYAEALSAASGAVVTDEAYKIFTDAVARNPRDAKSRYYLGLAHAQKGEIKKALQAWVDLRAISAPDAPWRSMIDGQIARAVKELGVDPARVKPSAEIQKLVAETKPQKTISSPPQSTPQSTPQSSPESVAPMRGPTAEDIRAAGEMTAQERAAFIRSMVQRLADRLKENPNDRMGWLRLARAYDVLGEKEKADEARAKAKALKP
jgi:cytochrome c-type biogenesis protein CcmH